MNHPTISSEIIFPVWIGWLLVAVGFLVCIACFPTMTVIGSRFKEKRPVIAGIARLFTVVLATVSFVAMSFGALIGLVGPHSLNSLDDVEVADHLESSYGITTSGNKDSAGLLGGNDHYSDKRFSDVFDNINLRCF